MIEAQTLTGNIEASELTGTLDKSIEIIEPNLQEKETTPTKQMQNITPDEEYNGLSKVVVNPIPSEYIIPALGEKTITENGTYISSDELLDGYNRVNVDVEGSGGTTINGKLVNKTIQSGNVAKGDFVGIGSAQTEAQITSDLRYYLPSTLNLERLDDFYSTDDTKFAKITAKNSQTAFNFQTALPTIEQLGIPSGKKVIDFEIESKVSYGGLSFNPTASKLVNLYKYDNDSLQTSKNLTQYTYTNEPISEFPKIFSFSKPSYITLTTDELKYYGIRYYYAGYGYWLEVYYIKYSITYEDEGKIKTVTGTSDHLLGIANENGSQGDTIQIYIPNEE